MSAPREPRQRILTPVEVVLSLLAVIIVLGAAWIAVLALITVVRGVIWWALG